jgi:hypothetical protein
MIHWFQSIEGLLLLALDGRSLSFYNTNTGIALLQSINAKRFRTFGEMASDFAKNQISCFQFASVVVDIFNRVYMTFKPFVTKTLQLTTANVNNEG